MEDFKKTNSQQRVYSFVPKSNFFLFVRPLLLSLSICTNLHPCHILCPKNLRFLLEHLNKQILLLFHIRLQQRQQLQHKKICLMYVVLISFFVLSVFQWENSRKSRQRIFKCIRTEPSIGNFFVNSHNFKTHSFTQRFCFPDQLSSEHFCFQFHRYKSIEIIQEQRLHFQGFQSCGASEIPDPKNNISSSLLTKPHDNISTYVEVFEVNFDLLFSFFNSQPPKRKSSNLFFTV